MIATVEHGRTNYIEALLRHFGRLDTYTTKYSSPNCMDWSPTDRDEVLREIERLKGMEQALSISETERHAMIKENLDPRLAPKE